MDEIYKRKYLKYKNKYIQLKEINGGNMIINHIDNRGKNKSHVIQILQPIALPEVEFVESPKNINFEKDVPMAIQKIFEEIYDKIIKYKNEVNCCFITMMDEGSNLVDIQKRTKEEQQKRGEKLGAIYGSLTDYVKLTPDFSKEVNNELIEEAISFVEKIQTIYWDMTNILDPELYEYNGYPEDKQKSQTSRLKRYKFTNSDIWKLYKGCYKKFVDQAVRSCIFFIKEIRNMIIEEKKLYFDIITEKPTGDCDTQMTNNAPFVIIMQQIIRFRLLVIELEKTIKKLNLNDEQEQNFDIEINKISGALDRLNELQRLIETKNKEKIGVQKIIVQIRDYKEKSKLIHHCDECNKTKDMKTCCTGDCKISSGIFSTKCIYKPPQ